MSSPSLSVLSFIYENTSLQARAGPLSLPNIDLLEFSALKDWILLHYVNILQQGAT